MTVAYAFSFVDSIAKCIRPCCAILTPPERKIWSLSKAAFELHSCVSESNRFRVLSFQLCEKELSDSGVLTKMKQVRALPLLPLSESISEGDAMMITCPAGHITHCFLAVDVNSACWEPGDVIDKGTILLQQNRSLTTCWHSLATLLVSFVCERSGDALPYTLVCDHRQDCWDNSDEEFCVFPLCSGRTPLKCSSREQVLN